MGTLFEALINRQNGLEDLLQKGQYAESTKFARDFVVVNKDYSAPLAMYADSAAKLDKADESKCISWWTVSTPCLDRDGDILDPLGCLQELGPFTKNPVVDFDHRRDYKLPIGKSIGEGTLPLIVTKAGVRAGYGALPDR